MYFILSYNDFGKGYLTESSGSLLGGISMEPYAYDAGADDPQYDGHYQGSTPKHIEPAPGYDNSRSKSKSRSSRHAQETQPSKKKVSLVCFHVRYEAYHTACRCPDPCFKK